MTTKLLGKRILAGIFSLTTVLSVMSCSSEKDMKDKIINEIRNANGKDISIDLNRFSKEKILKICKQTPYMTEESMEKRLGVQIDNFQEVDEGFYALWLVDDRQAIRKIEFQQGEIILGSQPIGCTSTSIVKIIGLQLYLNKEK